MVITYYWPPSGGISVHRSLKIVKYLRKFGWEPVVYTAKNADYPYHDEGNYKDIPENLEVIKRPILEPFRVFKILSGRKKNEPLNNIVHVRDRKRSIIEELSIWIRGNFFIPDARSLWIRPSVKFLLKYLKKHPVDAIFADGPPHTNTRIATHLAKELNIPFLADFQDPWTQVDYYQHMKITKWADKIHRRMELELFQTADKITIASPTWKMELENIGAKNVDVVYYGYDEDDFKNLTQKLDEKFSIVHTGLLGYDRNPRNLFQACKELSEENDSFRNDLELKFAGQIDYSVVESIIEHNLNNNFLNLGTISRQQALQLTLNAQLLLLPLNISKNIKGRMPGKFYEYLRAGRPIINIGPEDSDVGRIVNKNKCGIVVDYKEIASLKKFISNNYEKYKNKNIEGCKEIFLEFSVENQTQKIAKYLNEITLNEKQ